MCSWEVTWEIKNIISLPVQCLWPQDLSECWDIKRNSHSQICLNSRWGGHVRSSEKSNTLILHLRKTRGYQTRQGAYLQWQASILRAISSFHHVTNIRALDNLKRLIIFFFAKSDNTATETVHRISSCKFRKLFEIESIVFNGRKERFGMFSELLIICLVSKKCFKY